MPVTLDEVQHVPELFPVIKAAIDRTRQPGQFLLTGSANVMLLPTLSESLVGRMEVLTLWPLARTIDCAHLPIVFAIGNRGMLSDVKR